MGWLEDMTPGATLSAELRDHIQAAMQSFSDAQRRTMIRAGVRIWNLQNLPPEFDALERQGVISFETGGEARYFAELRIVQTWPRHSPYILRHELAHAWDHVRSGNVRSLSGLSQGRLETEIGRRVRMVWSDSDWMQRAFDLYKRRLAALRERGFERARLQFGLREGYASASPREFFAEGYAVFHGTAGGLDQHHPRLFLYARELYDRLAGEAGTQRLGMPASEAIQASIREQQLPPAPRL